MGFLEFWKPKPEPAFEREPSMSPVRCCGESNFSIGTVSFGWRVNHEFGIVQRYETGAIVLCNHCGRRIGINANGTYEPHPDALPGPWALADLKRDIQPTQPRQRPAFRKPPRDE